MYIICIYNIISIIICLLARKFMVFFGDETRFRERKREQCDGENKVNSSCLGVKVAVFVQLRLFAGE